MYGIYEVRYNKNVIKSVARGRKTKKKHSNGEMFQKLRK